MNFFSLAQIRLQPKFHCPRPSWSALKVCVVGGWWLVVVDIPIIIITLHSVKLSWVRLRWELINMSCFQNIAGETHLTQTCFCFSHAWTTTISVISQLQTNTSGLFGVNHFAQDHKYQYLIFAVVMSNKVATRNIMSILYMLSILISWKMPMYKSAFSANVASYENYTKKS